MNHANYWTICLSFRVKTYGAIISKKVKNVMKCIRLFLTVNLDNILNMLVFRKEIFFFWEYKVSV